MTLMLQCSNKDCAPHMNVIEFRSRLEATEISQFFVITDAAPLKSRRNCPGT